MYAHGKEDNLVDRQHVYQGFARNAVERQKKYREFVRGMLKEKKAMKGEMDRKLVYGGTDFVEMLTKEHLITGELRAIGRPKKTVKTEK